jgi:hypothetical protein
MLPKLNLLIFWGCPTYLTESTPVEVAMDALWRVAVLSLLTRAGQTNRFARLLVVTNDHQLANLVTAPHEVLLDTTPTHQFHFGRALRHVIKQADIGPDEAIIYVGAGAASLMSMDEWTALLDTVQNNPNSVTANNYFSADLVGWQPAQAIFRMTDDLNSVGDNNLAWGLCRQAGLTWRTFLPANTRTFGTQFDLDTPPDAALLKLWLSRQNSASIEWPRLHSFLQTTQVFDSIPIDSLLAALSDFNSEVLVSGRVSGQLHRLLEATSWGQTRILSEERGMRASGREEAGQVVSLLGSLWQQLGSARFFEEILRRTCQAAILDTRVLFAHQQLKPSRRDRFNSDALQPHYIVDQKVQEFTARALESDLPILIGGHTIVAGGLMLLLDLVPPKPYD